MMKRLLAVLVGTALFTAMGANIAQASNSWANPHMVTEPLSFRVHAAALGPAVAGYSGTDLLGGFTDSVTTKRVGTEISILDTTVAISTRGWPVIANQAISDTSGFFCQFNVYDATGTGCQTGMDSLYICAQGSLDGINWTSFKTFKTGAGSSVTSRLSQANGTGIFQGALTINGASLALGPPVWRVLYKQRAVSPSQSEIPDVSSMQTFPMLRFIVGFPDAGGYIVKASITHLSSVE
jgi:hypothetical protein